MLDFLSTTQFTILADQELLRGKPEQIVDQPFQSQLPRLSPQSSDPLVPARGDSNGIYVMSCHFNDINNGRNGYISGCDSKATALQVMRWSLIGFYIDQIYKTPVYLTNCTSTARKPLVSTCNNQADGHVQTGSYSIKRMALFLKKLLLYIHRVSQSQCIGNTLIVNITGPDKTVVYSDTVFA